MFGGMTIVVVVVVVAVVVVVLVLVLLCRRRSHRLLPLCSPIDILLTSILFPSTSSVAQW